MTYTAPILFCDRHVIFGINCDCSAQSPNRWGLLRGAGLKSILLFFTVLMLILSGCSSNHTEKDTSALASQLAAVSKDVESLKAENEKLKANLDLPAEQKQTEESSRSDFKEAEVVGIVDGDTIEINVDGKKDTVRLLLVDTPETKHPNKPVQPFGPEATQFAEKTLMGKQVRIEMDGPERDKYDRLLTYIWLGEKTFNEMLIEEGLARVAYVYDPPYTHYDQLLAAEQDAKSAKKGIWGVKGYVTADGFNEEIASSSEQPSEEPAADEQSVYFANCTEVRAAGADPIYEGEPGYSTKLDRDRDGVACE